jgi:hypothetical protein
MKRGNIMGLKLKKILAMVSALTIISTVSPALFGNEGGSFGFSSITAEAVDTTFWSGNLQYNLIETDIKKLVVVGCASGVTQLTIPSSVTYNGVPYPVKTISGLGGSTTVTSVNIPSSVNVLSAGAFSDFTALTSVNLPSSITSMPLGAFSGCTSLTSVSIPGTIKTIGSSSFMGCTKLSTVDLASGVTTIQSQAFYGCTSLANIAFPSSLTEIGSIAFKGSGLKILALPLNITTISSGAFQNCTSLTTVYNNSNTAYVAPELFSGCTSLTSVSFPVSATQICDSAFYGCTSLTSITIPSNFTEIVGLAFYKCTALTTANLPDSLTTLSTGAFTYTNLNFVDNKFLKLNFLAFEDSAYVNNKMKAHAQQIIADCGITSTTPAEQKIYLLHNYLCNMVTYTDELSSWYIYDERFINHHNASAMLYPMTEIYDETATPKGACSAYARAFYLLLNEAGITDSYYIEGDTTSGGYHAWNMVKLNGSWYYIDTTWDDNGTINYNYNYYLLTEAQMQAHSHATSEVSTNYLTREEFGLSEAPQTFVAPPATTGRKFGDVNNDGIVTQADLEMVTSYLAQTITFDATTKYYADLHCDGIININDVIALQKRVNFLNEG